MRRGGRRAAGCERRAALWGGAAGREFETPEGPLGALPRESQTHLLSLPREGLRQSRTGPTVGSAATGRFRCATAALSDTLYYLTLLGARVTDAYTTTGGRGRGGACGIGPIPEHPGARPALPQLQLPGSGRGRRAVRGAVEGIHPRYDLLGGHHELPAAVRALMVQHQGVGFAGRVGLHAVQLSVQSIQGVPGV